ncbi:MAG: ATP-binding protein [Granulosicoccaceae bacterium]
MQSPSLALSQSNPLKAVAEFVENSIDAGASEIEIIRGREKKEAHLRIRDNGHGISRDEEGLPNFKYADISQRLEQLGKVVYPRDTEVSILISSDSAEKLTSIFALIAVGSYTLQGRVAEIDVYKL